MGYDKTHAILKPLVIKFLSVCLIMKKTHLVYYAFKADIRNDMDFTVGIHISIRADIDLKL